MIKALEIIHERNDIAVDLVFTGEKKEDSEFLYLRDYVAQSEISSKIHFVGTVPETKLTWLYKNCSLVVIPTLYEAGSFPLLEAMVLGVPVICSAVTSLPETIGDERFLFNPHDVKEIADIILRMLASDKLKADSIENGFSAIQRLKKAWHEPCIFDLLKSVSKPLDVRTF